MMRVLCTANIGRGPNPTFAHTLKNETAFSRNDVLHVFDGAEPSFLYELIKEKGYPGYIVFDHFTNVKLDNMPPYYCLPLWLERESSLFIEEIQPINTIETRHCFNFQINKKQVNRHLCIKLIEYFDLVDYDYTWSGADTNFNMTDIIQEMSSLGSQNPVSNIGKLLQPITLPSRFIDFEDSGITDSKVTNYGGNIWTWKNFLESIINQTAVSLITESIRFQKGSVFTEKTLYAMLGMTFPIWIGGYNQAKDWELMGFDSFCDVVDHSYQSYDTLIERCYYAFERNLRLLTDRDYCNSLRKTHEKRLKRNQQLVYERAISNYIDAQIATYPADLQSVIPQIRQRFSI